MEKKDIEELEAHGIPSIIIAPEGKIVYQTPRKDTDKICNGCENLRLLPDPDPDDWFCDDDMKAYCTLLERTIAVSLHGAEITRVPISRHCPLLKDNNK